MSFASPEGRVLFQEALAAGTMERYFELAEQHHTQADPAFCGLASLVVVLNALAIDPGRLWKGPWRWFSEELLDCCVPLSRVRQSGLTIDELACLASCNGANATVTRAADNGEDDFRRSLELGYGSATGTLLIAGYSRAVLGQTGDGHFSPLAGYHRERDLALILDVARFKYPPHWVPVAMLFAAMREVDPVTARSRGWIAVERAAAPRNLAFVFTSHSAGWQRITQFLCEDARAHLARNRPNSAPSAVHELVQIAAETAAGIALRETADPQHRQLVEKALVELRATAVYEFVRAAEPKFLPEFGAALLFLLGRDTWSDLDPAVARELARICDPGQLPEPLRADLLTLRGQLDALIACGGTGAGCTPSPAAPLEPPDTVPPAP